MKTLANLFLYKTVFITGAAVLVIEVAAVRMLSPYYGSSLYVFSSVLTIILAALALGYYFGGRFADKQPHSGPLFAVIALSGIFTLFAEFLRANILPISSSAFSVMSGPLVFGFLLFFVPAFFLGIVSPYLVKLRSAEEVPEKIGSVAGTVFFWGTLGSISGSLLSGFLLIPVFGIRHSMTGTGLALLILGLAGMLFFEAIRSGISPYVMVARYRFFVLLVVLTGLVLTNLIYTHEVPSSEKVVYQSDGLYGHIIVYETERFGEPVMALRRDTNNESAVYLNSYDSVFEYVQFGERYKKVVPNTQSFLMIGGGAYSLPRTILARDPDVEVTVAEIEPDLFPLAQRFFDVPSSTKLVNHVVDGRVFLNEHEGTFDFIFLDAFGIDLSIPAHLATKEFYELVKAHLSDEGAVMLNFIGPLAGDAPTLTGSLVKTQQSVFPNMVMYAMHPEKPERRQNILFVLRNGDEPITLEGEFIQYLDGTVHPTSEMIIPHERYLNDDELVFTDDRAPIEYLMLDQY